MPKRTETAPSIPLRRMSDEGSQPEHRSLNMLRRMSSSHALQEETFPSYNLRHEVVQAFLNTTFGDGSSHSNTYDLTVNLLYSTRREMHQ